ECVLLHLCVRVFACTLFLADSLMYTERLPIQLFFVMKKSPRKKAILIFTGGMLLLASLALGITKARSVITKRNASANNTRLNEMPRVILWAWERPTDLRFINPRET